MSFSSLFTSAGSSVFEIVSTESTVNSAALIVTGIFILVFIAISFRLLHETAAALLGAVAIFLVTYIGGRFYPALSILTFEEAMEFVDWNVIFLILGMMIFMAILSDTNVFRWLGLRLYRRAKGNIWLVVVLLVTMTGFTSALLNDVTAILL
ncbi:MAG: SLC13 family permease, partial [Anaerolineales bacterium]